jgi:hypothetical protein
MRRSARPDLDQLPNELAEPVMTPEEYLGRVRATAWRAAEYISADRLEEVHRLIDRGEPAEGLCSLAWAIVNAQVRVPRDLIEAISEYTAGLIDGEFMPPNLGDFSRSESGP